MSEPAVKPDEYAKLNDYERGVVDGIFAYAWWKDGTLYVGRPTRTYGEAVDAFLRKQGKR